VLHRTKRRASHVHSDDWRESTIGCGSSGPPWTPSAPRPTACGASERIATSGRSPEGKLVDIIAARRRTHLYRPPAGRRRSDPSRRSLQVSARLDRMIRIMIFRQILREACS
jgi:hypothetical protein